MFVFFFQAEDGIRDLVRSRGLGDVYKRQVPPEAVSDVIPLISDNFGKDDIKIMLEKPFGNDLNSAQSLIAVSYTHLTLPTSDLV